MFLRNLSAVLILFTINSNATLDWGDDCELENGSKGVCIEAVKCQQVYKSIILGKGNKPKLCEYKGKETTVCCDDGNVTETVGIRSVQACRKWGPNLYKQTPFIHSGRGIASSIAEFPHMAALGYDYVSKNGTYWGCGGSLISLKFVLTAAHCIHSFTGSVKHVRLGDLDLRSADDDTNSQDFLVSSINIHPLYKRPMRYHDIALIQLDRAAIVTKFVQPACLNVHFNNSISHLTATGWGMASFYGNPIDRLQISFLLYANNTECRKSYEVNSQVLSEGIQEKYQICAGYKEIKDSCQGDSGGPLQTRTKSGNYYIHGIISFGKPCFLTNSPAVYTRVSNYIDWIESIVWPNTK